MEFLKTYDCTAINTRFQKTPEKLVTYKEKVLQHNPEREEYDGDKGPYDHTKYAQCDYVLTKKEHFHTVLDCEVHMNKAKNTDHYPPAGAIQNNMKLSEKQQRRQQSKHILETRCTRNAGIQQNNL